MGKKKGKVEWETPKGIIYDLLDWQCMKCSQGFKEKPVGKVCPKCGEILIFENRHYKSMWAMNRGGVVDLQGYEHRPLIEKPKL